MVSAIGTYEDTVWALTCPLLVTAGVGQALVKTWIGGSPINEAPEAAVHAPEGSFVNISFAGTTRTRQPLVFERSCTVTCEQANTSNLTDTLMKCPSTFPRHCFSTQEGPFPASDLRISRALASLLAEQDWAHGFITFVDMRDSLSDSISSAVIIGGMSDTSTGPTRYVMSILIYVCLGRKQVPRTTTDPALTAGQGLFRNLPRLITALI